MKSQFPTPQQKSAQVSDFVNTLLAPQRERKMLEADLRIAKNEWQRDVLLPF